MNGRGSPGIRLATTPARIPVPRRQVGNSLTLPVNRNLRVDGIANLPAGQSVKLRPATPDDLELLRRWDEKPHVVASDPNDDWAWETELTRTPEWREQLIAEVGNRPIGFLQIIDPAREDSHYWGCMSQDHRVIDIWIGESADLGQGYGTAMMKLAIIRSFADPTVLAVLVDPRCDNLRAHRFYERLGFELVAERRFGEDDCLVYRLTRNKAAAHLQST